MSIVGHTVYVELGDNKVTAICDHLWGRGKLCGSLERERKQCVDAVG